MLDATSTLTAMVAACVSPPEEVYVTAMLAVPWVEPATTAKEQPVGVTEVKRLWREDWSKPQVML